MSEWKSFCLGDVCIINAESYSKNDNWTFVNYLDTGNITANKIEDVQYINILEEKFPSRARRKVKTDSIIYSTVRPNQRHYGIIKSQPKNFLVSTGFAVIDVNPEIVDANFLYYRLTQDEVVQYLQSVAEQSTTAYPSIRPADVENLKFSFPSMDTQKKIAAVLSALDDKIELNNAINKNLEEQAQAIYKNMFVDKFKIGSIGDYCKVKSGYAFKSKWWQNKGIRVIKIGSINQDELNLMECSFVSEDKLEIAKNFVVSAGDLVIAMTGATIGKFTFVPRTDEVLLVNQRVGKFFLGDEPIQRLPFIYCTLKQDSVYTKLINKGQGSAQPNISPQDIMSIPCIMPPDVEIEKFNKVTLPFFETMSENYFENQKLGELRDTLLPRLMSGEIDVSEVEI